MVCVYLIFPVRNKLWLNRHPFADIIVCTKGSCWLSCIAGAHTAEWQREDCSETWLVAAPENQAVASVDENIPISSGSSVLDCLRTGQGTYDLFES